MRKGGELSQAREQEDVNKGRRKRGIKGGETKLGDVKRRQIESNSDGNMTGGQSKSVLSDCTEPTYPSNLAISPQYTERALLIEGIVSSVMLSEESTEPIYPSNLSISLQYTERALLIEGIVSFATLSPERMPDDWRERGKCHQLPMEDMMEAFWGGVTPLTVVSGDAGIGRVCDGSHGD